MLTQQQQKVVEINNITTRQIESGWYEFLIAGRYCSQKASYTEEGALKKGIGYVMSKRRR